MLKDIPGYEDLYAVTENGEVWSYPKKWWGHSHNGMWLKQSKISGGYNAVAITKNIDGKLSNRAYGVHRLVALAYIPLVPGKLHVNHIDHSRTNNHVSNLEWVTRSENTLHAAKIGRMSRFIPKKYTWARINLVRELSDNNLSRTFIAELLNMPTTTVSAIARNIMRTKAWILQSHTLPPVNVGSVHGHSGGY